jgi:5'-AMP-activated protein kinase regulatory beta subunit
MSVDDSGPTLLQSRHVYPPGRSGSTEDPPEFSPSKNSIDEEDEIELERQLQGLQTESDVRKIPSVVKWEGGGHCVSVSFDDGATNFPMAKSSSNFYTILDLPEGTHKYRFFVDGQWKCDPKEPKVSEGNSQYNVVNVKSSDFEVFEALAVDSIGTESAKFGVSGSPPGSYSQIIPQKHGQSNPSIPPTLPPQLLQVILNTETPLQCEPTVLPEPNHVMLNHLYALSIKDGVMVMSGTHRYRKKYVTTLLYKPT